MKHKVHHMMIPLPSGGHRKQSYIVLESGKRQFVKNASTTTTKKKSHGGASHHSKKKGTHVAKKSKAMTKAKKSHHPAKKHRTRRRKHHSAIGVVPIALSGIALGYLTGAQGPAFIKDNLAKVPGAKTFGTVAVAGAAALAVDKWMWRNKYLRLAGYIGIGIAALNVGAQGTNFKWLGDEESSGDYDLADEDMGDDDMGDMGDDDMGDEESGDVGDDE